MAEIIPTPATGGYTIVTPQGAPWTPQPATGGYTIVTPQGAPWTPQPATGGYTIVTPQGPDRKRGARGFGMVRGNRG